MFTGNKSIQLIGYTAPSVKTAGIRLVEEGEVETVLFSTRKLVVALARTILAMAPKDEQLIYQAVSSYSALYPLISSGQEFCFVEDVELKVRDFLLSTRTGELAPAMSYLFAQEQLHRPFVVDFTTIATNETGQVVPDLLASNARGEVAFLDSKGSRDVRNKGKLREALLISEKAVTATNIVATDFYGMFISVTKCAHETGSAMHYSHTKNEVERIEEPLFWTLIYQHYATWFMLLGYTKQAKKLAEGKSIKLKKLRKKIRIEKEKYYVLNSKKSLFLQIVQHFDQSFASLSFAISEDVLHYLQGGNQLILPIIKDVQKVNSEWDLFADGTCIKNV